MKRFVCAAISAAIVAVPASSTTPSNASAPVSATTPMPVAQIAPQPSSGVLRAGTPVALRTLEELTTNGKRLKVGQRFNMEVSEAVVLGGQTVIPVGSKAVGEVTSVRNKGMWGKSGNIEARVLYVRVGEQQIRLSGSMNDKGVTGTAGVVAAIALVPVVGFFTTGTSAVIASGAPVKGFTDEDVPVVFAAPTPAPLMVPATEPAPATITPAASTKI